MMNKMLGRSAASRLIDDKTMTRNAALRKRRLQDRFIVPLSFDGDSSGFWDLGDGQPFKEATVPAGGLSFPPAVSNAHPGSRRSAPASHGERNGHGRG